MSARAESTDRTITTPDGRDLRLHEAGSPDGVPVVIHHGTPGAGLLHGPWHTDALARGLRLVSFDRPGYGGSTRRPGRDVASVAEDVAAVLDALGIQACLTWGASGGGPHALATAALLPGRVRAAATVAGVAPWDADGLDPLAGMGPENVEEFGLAQQGEARLAPFLAPAREAMLATTPAEVEQLAGLLPPVDLAALAGAGGEYLHASFVSALSGGVDGWVDDDLAFVRAWGFDLAAVEVPVLVVQGGRDLMVPPAHGRWLAEHLPGSSARLEPDEGHVSLALDASPVHAWLLEQWRG